MKIKNKVLSYILILSLILMQILPYHTVSATSTVVEVSTFEEFKAAFNANNIVSLKKDIICTETIIPNGFKTLTFNGIGYTLQVEKLYLNEDGTLA